MWQCSLWRLAGSLVILGHTGFILAVWGRSVCISHGTGSAPCGRRIQCSKCDSLLRSYGYASSAADPGRVYGGASSALPVADPLIKGLGIQGASWLILGSMLLVTLLFAVMIAVFLKKKQKKQEEK